MTDRLPQHLPEYESSPEQDPAALFFQHIEKSGTLPANVHARDAASAILCTLSFRLWGDEARELVHSVPTSMQPLFQRCVIHRDEPPEVFDRHSFMQRVADHLRVSPEHAEAATRAVLEALQRFLPEFEARQLEYELPRDLKDLWPYGGTSEAMDTD